MPAHYQNVSIEEMRGLLDSSKGWKESESEGRVKESVFHYNLKRHPHILVKIYTGIKKESGASRSVGKDAIRVCAVNLATDRGWIKAKRVHRTQNWRDNLKGRIIQVISESNKRFDS